jgi:uncharacterized oxidoreductase
MKTTQNTVLITGGGSGIGFEIAKAFVALQNNVIITGRNKNRLEEAALKIPGVTTIQCDVTNQTDIKNLAKVINNEFPSLNIVVNNAGQVFVNDLAGGDNIFSQASEEILTNYLSAVRLNDELLDLLKAQKESAIVNVSSIVALVPSLKMATYSASKAALHSYSQALRLSLNKTVVKVFELMPPLVNTQFSKEIGGEKGIAPSVVAQALLDALERNLYEIHVGNTANIFELSRTSPADAIKIMNPTL